MQIPCLGLIKLSFMLFFKRIFAKGKGKAFSGVIHAIVGLIVCWIIAFFFSYLFLCTTNPSYYWTSLFNEKEYCNNSTQLHLGYAISDFLFDVGILLFPMPLVWRRWVSMLEKLLADTNLRSGRYTCRQAARLVSQVYLRWVCCKLTPPYYTQP